MSVIVNSKPNIIKDIDIQNIINTVYEQPIFFNDLTSKHWMFMYKYKFFWVDAISINNDLNEFIINISL